MIGAIIGDYIGSIYEWNNVKHTEFPLFSSSCRFTDDSVMSIAVADALMNGGDMAASLRRYGRMYPCAGYGGRFRQWVFDDSTEDYGSYGNGSAMRASAAGWMASSLEEALELAVRSAMPTHSHPEGVRGAKAVAGCIWLLRNGADKQALRDWVTELGYELNFTIAQIRPTYEFDVSCQGSVPHAIEAFLEAEDFESAIRLAISIGGDSDTIACITGALAEAFWGIPESIVGHVVFNLPLELYAPLAAFEQKYANPLPAYAYPMLPPPGLSPLSAAALSNYWSRLSARYSARQSTRFSAYDVFIHEMMPALKKGPVYGKHPICTFNLLPLIAYYAEGMLSGSSRKEHLDPGPCSISLGSDSAASEPHARYMLTLFEQAISDSPHLRDYMRRRINTLHDTPVPADVQGFRMLIRLCEEEYREACERGDWAQAWLIFGVNQILDHMQEQG